MKTPERPLHDFGNSEGTEANPKECARIDWNRKNAAGEFDPVPARLFGRLHCRATSTERDV
jgi:hypothetical protein